MDFKSKEELFKRIFPALSAKIHEFKYNDYIKEADVWNYLIETKWKYAHDLTLSQVVSDIFSVSLDEIDSYLKQKLKNSSRKIYFEEVK